MRAIAVLLCLAWMSACASAATIWVDVNNTSGVEDGSAAYPFNTIQEGIDAAGNGDEVVVLPGEYVETITFVGSGITSDFALRSNDPLDPTVVAATVINADLDGDPLTPEGSVVTLSGDEDEGCLVSGFTVTGGYSDAEFDLAGAGGVRGGPRYGNWTRAAITHCVIRDNRGRAGGGLSYCAGEIASCTISSNYAEYGSGGGLMDCNATVRDCLITQNSATWEGGGLCECKGPVLRNTVAANVSEQWGGGLDDCDGLVALNLISGNRARDSGGGLRSCSGHVIGNVISGNAAGGGGGLYTCHGSLIGNTITGNFASGRGGGLSYCHGTMTNCIIWGNTASRDEQVYKSSAPSYSCVQDWTGGGWANTADSPDFYEDGYWTDDPGYSEWIDGDYRLGDSSSCVNGGLNGLWFGCALADIAGRCRLACDSVDIGAHERSAHDDTDADLLDDGQEAVYGTDPLNPDTDGDGVLDGVEVLRGTDPHTDGGPVVFTVPGDFPTIQRALGVAGDGDAVVVAPGLWREQLFFCGPDVVLRGEDPLDPAVVSSTVITGDLDGEADEQEGNVVLFFGSESPDCELAGLTITGGRTGGDGAGGGIAGHGTCATICHCVIKWNTSGYGGGLAHCNGSILENTITANSGISKGGGLCFCDGPITGNTISCNHVDGHGGGCRSCDGPITGNLFQDNEAWYGGALENCDGGIEGNTFIGNSASGGGAACSCEGRFRNNLFFDNSAGVGGALSRNHCPVENCVFYGNTAWIGGAIDSSRSSVTNCTIVGNRADGRGGGFDDCSGVITNCIIWGNTATSYPQLSSTRLPDYSCVESHLTGVGCTRDDPMLVDIAAGDFRLLPGSPCIDSANGDVAPESDITGRLRWDHPEVANTGVGSPPYADMGAYESYLQTFTTPPGLLRQGWNLVSLPVDPAPPYPESVWDNNATAGNALTGNLYGYINPTGYTEYPRTLTAMEQARGYWLRLRYPTAEDVVGEEPPAPASVALQAGWNLIGHPLAQDVPWSACTVDDGQEQLSIADAEAAGWLQGTLFFFSPVSQYYRLVPADDDSLRPWYGYWLLAHQDGLTLIVP